ncbi:hypothetical protein [Streptomyces sp. NPDC101776]|uniref:hypothetical protein n=1 Tax=Streptomyces sp. NPDC101776 TaxID=3366146 RepID=UPI00381E9FDE
MRWPSSSRSKLKGGYERIRDRAHAMSAEGKGHAPYVVGHLLGYLDGERGDPTAPAVLAGRSGQYLRLMGHSFGGRFLCEAVQRAAEPPPVLGWSTARPAPPRSSRSGRSCSRPTPRIPNSIWTTGW